MIGNPVDLTLRDVYDRSTAFRSRYSKGLIILLRRNSHDQWWSATRNRKEEDRGPEAGTQASEGFAAAEELAADEPCRRENPVSHWGVTNKSGLTSRPVRWRFLPIRMV